MEVSRSYLTHVSLVLLALRLVLLLSFLLFLLLFFFLFLCLSFVLSFHEHTNKKVSRDFRTICNKSLFMLLFMLLL
jgi:hypothetical protein